MLHDIFFYHPETVWVLVPLFIITGGFITRWQSTNAKIVMAHSGSTEAMLELRDAVQRLELRVANLERAAMTVETERRYAL
jgi:hypothetical protein